MHDANEGTNVAMLEIVIRIVAKISDGALEKGQVEGWEDVVDHAGGRRLGWRLSTKYSPSEEGESK